MSILSSDANRGCRQTLGELLYVSFKQEDSHNYITGINEETLTKKKGKTHNVCGILT